MPASLPRLTAVVLSLSLLSGCGRLIATIERPVGPARVAAEVPRGPLQTFQPFAPAQLTVFPAGMRLPTGSRQRLTVKVHDTDGQLATVAPTITSRSPSVLRVLPDQTVEAIAPGRGELVVTAGGSAMVVVVDALVAPPPLEAGGLRIKGANAYRVEAHGALPEALTVEEALPGTVTWRSSAPEVATVDAAGRITVKQNGVVGIQAAIDGVTSPAVELTIAQRPYTFRTSGPDGARSLRLARGEAAALTTVVQDANQNPMPVDGYQVDSASVATVDAAGQLRAKAAGQTLIRPIAAQLTGADRAALALGVEQSPPVPAAGAGSLDAAPARFTLPVGGRQALAVQVRDAAGAVITPPLTYTAEPAGIVAVDERGQVSGLKPGQALVRVTGFGLARSVPVTVAAPAPGGLQLTGASELVLTSLGPLAGPLGVGTPGAQWSSADPGVVTVDGEGRLTAIADGKTTLTATVGSERASVAVTVDQRPAFLAVHGTLEGDPRQIVVHQAGLGFAFTGTAFDFNGNAMAIERIVSDNARVVAVGQDGARIQGRGSAYVRAICKGVRSSNANSVLVHSLAELGDARGTTDGDAASGQAPAGVPVLSVQVQQAAVGLAVGGQTTLTVTVRDDQNNVVGTVPDFTTDDPTVATVDANGTIVAIAPGTANIQVSVPGDLVTVPVTVTAPGNPDLSVNPTSLNASAFGAVGAPLVVTTNQGAVTWTTSNAGVASVDNAGNVTINGNGNATLTARAGALSVDVPVAVDQRASFVRVDSDEAGNPRAITLLTGETAQISGTARDANGNAMAVESFVVAAGDAGILAVDAGGNLTAVGPGSAYVRVTTRGPVTSADAESVLVTVAARTLSVNPNSLNVASLGVVNPLTATTNQGAVAWSSSNNAVATVDNAGNVTSVADGSATITATAGTSTVNVNVTVAQRATTVLVSSSLVGDPRNIVFNRLGDTLTLTAAARDANNRNVPIVGWESSNPAVATVDGNGNVTIVSDGTAFIRVITNGNVASSDAQSVQLTVDVNNAGSVDTTINLP